MSTLIDWLWNEEPMKEVERGFTDYMEALASYIYDEDDGDYENFETESGFAYCGCEDCSNREIFAYLMPRFLDLYRNGHITMRNQTFPTRFIEKFMGSRFRKNRKAAVLGKTGDSTPKSITELFKVEPGGSDYMFMGPLSRCICGCNVFHILASFDDDGEIAQYFTEAKCASCGSLLRAPTPVDNEV